MSEKRKPFLKIAVAPLDIVFGEPTVNIANVESNIKNLDEYVDILVLPELFSTGFKKDAETMASLAEPIDGITVSRLKELSDSYKIAICGSFVCNENNEIFNRSFFIKPNGSAHYYDKHHLFTMGGEQNIFHAGKGLPEVIEFKGWKIMMAICYDVRFPAWLRNHNLKYDVLIVPANWAHSRAYAWKHLLIARAIENQAYVIGCNRSGCDEYGEYPAEDSFAFNYWGKDISVRLDNEIIYCTLDIEKMNIDRNRFSPWRDADSFTFRELQEE
ncbi:MAG: nitrilase family protein [Paramuribaculum sp.]|nr:nitrilase family protein [Paramuribaculum sp.]